MRADGFYSRLSVALGDAGLKTVGKLNVPLYRASKGMLFGKIGRSPVLLLTTIGRRSGKRRTTPVLYAPHGDRLVLIGSNAGNERVPAWALNLIASPHAEVELRGRRLSVQSHVAEGQEREALWRKMVEQYRGFEHYRGRTNREFSVFVLTPSGSASTGSDVASES